MSRSQLHRLHRFLAKDARSLVSRYGHKGLPNKNAIGGGRHTAAILITHPKYH